MKINKIDVINYKSIRDASFSPGDFTVIVGRNSSGKSNFADALDFLALTYSDGLEHAVARKGGYENIAHRKERRSRSAVSFAIDLTEEVRSSELLATFSSQRRKGSAQPDGTLRFQHSFSFKAAGSGISSDFKIEEEKVAFILELHGGTPDMLRPSPRSYKYFEITRDENGVLKVVGDLNDDFVKSMFYAPFFSQDRVFQEIHPEPTVLTMDLPFFRYRTVARFKDFIRNISICRASPDASRSSGVPTPNPRLAERGDNLPAVVNWLKSKRPGEWKAILQSMREIVPEIDDITVQYLYTRTLGIFFVEKGVGRQWSAEEVSDGTIRSLAMLVACFDPRVSALILEEPENSLHPWIIKELISQMKVLSRTKAIVVTTHSPIVLNSVSPDEVWIAHKAGGETSLRRLTSFDSQLMADWEGGAYRLFDYLESGIIPEAVPGGLMQ